MAHIPQSQDDHQMTMEDSEHNFQNIVEDIQMVRYMLFLLFFIHLFIETLEIYYHPYKERET